MEQKIRLYISNVSADALFRQELEAALIADGHPLVEIIPSTAVLPETGEGIDIFIALLSEDYIYYLTNPFNTQRARELFVRADQRLTLFCPVVVRECPWNRTDFKRFRMLPIPMMQERLHPVAEDTYWGNRGEAWKKVVADLRIYVGFMEEFREKLQEAARINAEVGQKNRPDVEPIEAEQASPQELEELANLLPSTERYVYREKPMQKPLRMGFLAADMRDPAEKYWLDYPEWDLLQQQGIEWVPIPNLRRYSLFEWVWRERLAGLHFSAWRGEPQPLQLPPDVRTNSETTETIFKTLQFFYHQLDLVFFSGCYTPALNSAFANAVPNAIGTYPVTPQPMSLNFTQLFYQALANDASYPEAFALAKASIHPRYVPKERMPVLVQRFG